VNLGSWIPCHRQWLVCHC